MNKRNYFLFNLIFILIGTLIGGCTTTFVANSTPDQTEVFYITKKSGEKKLIGTTPIQIPMLEFRTKIGEDLQPGEFYKIQMEKKGYQSETFNIPVTRFGTLMTKLEVNLVENKKNDEEEKQAKSLIDRLFLAQRLAQLKEFERAQIEIDKILVDHPQFARAMTMRASIYLAQNNIPESIKWYENALTIDSQMEDVLKILAKLKNDKQLPDRLPASKGGP